MTHDLTALEALPPLREVIAEHGLNAKKSLGQNFIFDLNVTRRIARAAGPLEGMTVLEVGPGPGGLTRALLLEGADAVIAIERDERALPALAEISSTCDERLQVINADALKYAPDIEPETKARIVANLPYNVGTALLIRWLSEEPWPAWFDRMVLMFQREVADRLTAQPGTKAFGRLSVLAQWRCDVERLFDLDPKVFIPPPSVVSSVVRLTPKAIADEPKLATVEKVTTAIFGQRRKMLRATLKPLVSDQATLLELLEDIGIEPTQRAEELSVEQILALAARIEALQR